MLFPTANFLVFFTVVFALYWGMGLVPLAPAALRRARVGFLLAASYFFYACWDWRFLGLILFSTILDFAFGRRIHQAPTETGRRRWVQASVAANLAFLGFFKYFNFFVSGAQQCLAWLGLPAHPFTLQIILPVGISFYTFQSLSYTIDIYRRKLEPEPSFLNFAFFISFFPHIVAGPIVRAADFLPQVHAGHRLRQVNFDGAVDLILRGMIKKVLISDVVAAFADQVFANPAAFGTLNAWLGLLTYALQIYCDFSGYTDIAIGVAGLLDYRLMRNFDYPYMARGFSDFWRRWHISLSVWLRDYLYISLGGNRAGAFKTYRNLMLTMLLGGLWHGAAWTFVAWGALHGLYLVAERLLANSRTAAAWGRLPRALTVPLGILATFLLVNVAWVFFRAPGLHAAGAMLARLFTWAPDAAIAMPLYARWVMGLGLAFHVLGELKKHVRPRPLVWAGLAWRPLRYSLLVILLIMLSAANEQPFIYFQF